MNVRAVGLVPARARAGEGGLNALGEKVNDRGSRATLGGQGFLSNGA